MNKISEQQQAGVERARREAYWRNLWQKHSWRSYALSPFAVMFHLIGVARRGLYRTGFFDSSSAPVPVIMVGGIMVGGVGKTPVVASLARSLQKAGFTPAVISRGYTLDKKKNDLPPREVTDLSDPADVGDEPILLKIKTGLAVWVGRNRAEVARALCRAYPKCDVIICDDGLQHYALSRDIEIAVMDDRGVGNGWCLPAGPLRESERRLDGVDAVVWHHRCENENEVCARKQESDKSVNGHHFNFYSYLSDAYDLLDPTYRLPLSYFAGKSTLALAGIAQPEVFFNMLVAHNVRGSTLPLPDHFHFDESFALREVVRRAQYVLMTEKDAVKYKHLITDQASHLQRFWVVPLEIIDNLALQELSRFLVERLTDIAPEFTKEYKYE